MLNVPTWALPLPKNQTADAPPEPAFRIRDIPLVLRRDAPWILLSSLAGFLVAAIVVLTTSSTYVAKAQLVIDPKMPALFSDRNDETRAPLDTGQVANQIAILKSEKIATSVIDQLQLYLDPEFRGGQSRLSAWLSPWLDRHPAIQSAVEVPPLKTIAKALGVSPPKLSDFEISRRVMTNFLARLDVRRSGIAYALDVAFTSNDPDKSARIANAVVNAFLDEKMEARASAARDSSKWLEERLALLRTRMNASAIAVQEFRATHDFRIVRDRSQLGENEKADRASLEELESRAAAFRKIYETFLETLTDAIQKQMAPLADARIITPATRPLFRAQTSKKLVMLAGAFGGAGLFVAYSFGMLLLRPTVRSARQLRDIGSLRCLGRLQERSLGPNDWRSRVLSFVRAPIERRRGSRSTAVMGGGRLREVLIGAAATEPLRSVGILAPGHCSARRTVATALATAWSRSGARVLVVEFADGASLVSRTDSAEARPSPGKDQEIVVQAPEAAGSSSGFHRLQAGAAMRAARESAGIGQVRQAIQETSLNYDLVILELPSIRDDEVAGELALVAESLVLAIESHRTPIAAVQDILTELEAIEAPLTGAVLIEA